MVKENPNQCSDLPKGLAKAILNMHDTDGDGRLDFEEFYKLSQHHSWLVRDMCVKYCRYVIPRRGGAVADETGESYFLQINLLNIVARY
jgi:rhomboid-related protein 1/2/3